MIRTDLPHLEEVLTLMIKEKCKTILAKVKYYKSLPGIIYIEAREKNCRILRKKNMNSHFSWELIYKYMFGYFDFFLNISN